MLPMWRSGRKIAAPGPGGQPRGHRDAEQRPHRWRGRCSGDPGGLVGGAYQLACQFPLNEKLPCGVHVTMPPLTPWLAGTA